MIEKILVFEQQPTKETKIKKKSKRKRKKLEVKICDDQIWNERTFLEYIAKQVEEEDDRNQNYNEHDDGEYRTIEK